MSRWAVQKRLNRSRCRLGSDSCGSKKSGIRWGHRCPTGRGFFWRTDMYQRIVMYLRMSALRRPRANVPAPRTRRTNVFTAARSNKTRWRSSLLSDCSGHLFSLAVFGTILALESWHEEFFSGVCWWIWKGWGLMDSFSWWLLVFPSDLTLLVEWQERHLACKYPKMKKLKAGHLYSTYLWELTSKALRMIRINTVLPAIHTFVHDGINHPVLTGPAQRITALCPVLISRPTEGKRLRSVLFCAYLAVFS